MENIVTAETTNTSPVYSQKKVTYKLDQIIWYIIGVIDSLLVLRLIMVLLGANRGNSFIMFLYGVTEMFVAPFRGILGNPAYGNNQFEWDTLFAIIIITLIGQGIAYLIRLATPVSDRQVIKADNKAS